MSSKVFLFCAAVLTLVFLANCSPSRVYECAEPFCNKVPPSLYGAVKTRVAPGIAAAAVNRTNELFVGTVGQYTYDPNSAIVTDKTLFDMASCTKVMATTTAVAVLYQRGLLDLNEKISSEKLLGPSFSSHGKGEIVVRNLLLHNAGFPPDPVPGYWSKKFPCPQNAFYHPGQEFSCVDIILNDLLWNQTLINPPGYKYVYSDLSMITMMFVVGKVVLANQLVSKSDFVEPCFNETSLVCNYHAFIHKKIIKRLQMPSAGFVPTNSLMCVPEWSNDTYRHVQVAGFVSDQNAYALGGISGHAGLFASVRDAIQLMRLWMFQTDSVLLNSSTVTLFTTVWNISQSSRALGWDTNAQSNPPCGKLSNKTFLHLGYTGTELCGDPEADVFTVLLGNGRYPDFRRDGMIQYRPIFNSLISDLLKW